jgi:hypothetical protein
MKKAKIILSVFSALAIAAPTYAVDPNEPGKASDSVKQPSVSTESSAAAGSGTATSSSTPTVGGNRGKESDPIREDISNKTAGSGSNAQSGTSYHGKVTAIDKSDKIVTIDDQKSGKQKLHIDESTKFMKGDEKASWNDLKVGDELHGSLKKMEGDKHHAISAKIGK